MKLQGIAVTFLFAIFLSVGQASAVPVTVPNFSFEDPDVADGDATQTIPGWTTSVSSGFIIVEDPSTTDSYPGAPGDNSPLPSPAAGGQAARISVESVSLGGQLTTGSLTTTQLNTLYTLTVAVGEPADNNTTTGTAEIQLLINDGLVQGASAFITNGTIPNGAFTNLQAAFLAPASGLDLKVRLIWQGQTALSEQLSSVNFDNVRLDEAAAGAQIPEPATLLLLGSGLAGLAAWRRFRTKTT